MGFTVFLRCDSISIMICTEMKIQKTQFYQFYRTATQTGSEPTYRDKADPRPKYTVQAPPCILCQTTLGRTRTCFRLRDLALIPCKITSIHNGTRLCVVLSWNVGTSPQASSQIQLPKAISQWTRMRWQLWGEKRTTPCSCCRSKPGKRITSQPNQTMLNGTCPATARAFHCTWRRRGGSERVFSSFSSSGQRGPQSHRNHRQELIDREAWDFTSTRKRAPEQRQGGALSWLPRRKKKHDFRGLRLLHARGLSWRNNRTEWGRWEGWESRSCGDDNRGKCGRREKIEDRR